MDYIKSLNEISSTGVSLVGGKAASLGEMINAGLSVPNGFVVTTDAFREFLDHNQLTDKISTALNGLDQSDTSAIDEAAKNITELINEAVVWDDLRDEIMAAHTKRNAAFVAVRSSATAEDSATAAWAGQLDTFLNVSEAQVVNRVKDCWASLYSPRAIFYRIEQGLVDKEVSVGVIVQEMVDSEKSGIAFSMHPVSQNSNEMIIEAGYGLGEAIVSGQVTPDSYTFTKDPFTIASTTVNSQQRGLYRSGSGGNEWRELGSQGAEPVLTESEVLELGELVLKIEQHYGFPCDIEWAFADGQFYITQSRPITTLEKQVNAPPPLYEPGTDIFRWGPIPGKWFYIGDFIETVFLKADSLKQFGFNKFPECHIILDEERVLWMARNNEFRQFCQTLFQTLNEKQEALTKLRQTWEAAKQALEEVEQAIETGSSGALILAKSLQATITDFWLPTLPGEFGNYGAEDVLKKALTKYIDSDREIGKAMQVLTAPTEPSYFQQANTDLLEATNLKQYATKYHWLDNSYGGVSQLSAEDFASRQADLSTDLMAVRDKQFAELKKERQILIEKYQLPTEIVAMSELTVSLILEQDERKAHMLKLQYYKEMLLQKIVKEKNVDEAVLRQHSLQEISDWLEGKRELRSLVRYSGVKVSGGSLEYLLEEKVAHYWRQYSKDKVEGSDSVLTGIVASRSQRIRSRGRVKVVLNPSQVADFPAGSILVTTMTSPEYVHLMKKSHGIITDTGGLTSHAAIISRELNVPCIVGTRLATQLLKDGDEVELDTHGGIVRIIKES